MSPQFTDTTEFIRRLYYRHLRRYGGSLFLTSICPMLGIVLFLPLPSTTRPVLLVVWLGATVITFLGYAVRHHRALEREVAPVAHLAALGRSTAQVAHDLMGPLSSMHVALRDFRDDAITSPQAQARVRLLRLSAARLERVAHQVLDATAARHTTTDAVDVQQLVATLIQEYQLHPKMTGIRFQIDASAEPVWIRGDRDVLERALANLIKNAVEAMQFHGTLTLRTSHCQEMVVLSISDTGPGLSAELIAAVNRGEGRSVGKSNGHGLGLQSVWQVIVAHGGTMTIQPPDGTGAHFELRLPRATPQAADTNVVAFTR